MAQTQKRTRRSRNVKKAKPPVDSKEKAPLKERETTRSSEWKNQAEFTIFFDCKEDEHGAKVWQTRVYDAHDGGTEPAFEGLDPINWVSFVLQQIGFSVDDAALMAKSASEENSTRLPALDNPPSESVNIEFQKVDVDLWPEEPSLMLEGRACLKISGKTALKKMKKEDSCRVEFFVVEMETHRTTQVAVECLPLNPKIKEFEIKQLFRKPGIGRYRFQTCVLLPSLGIAATQAGPIFNIV